MRHERLPAEIEPVVRKAVVMEWITIGYLISVIVLMYLVLGASQAMSAAWIEDILGLVPAVIFLAANPITHKPPNERYPYGYHRALNIAFVTASFALLLAGLFVLYESLMALLKQEHPTIPTVTWLFDEPIWLGWYMIAVLVYSSVPVAIIGRKKLPLAKELHDKTLNTDAQMQKADWMTAGAAILGILGIGLGLWWADATAALLIALSIVFDGAKNMKIAVLALIDHMPQTLEGGDDPLIDQVRNTLQSFDWVESADVRLREHGRLMLGEARVKTNRRFSTDDVSEALERVYGLHWRMREFVIEVD